jgi:UDP:flavonoid glycosyltransferase YjiC (YdhE family)
VPTVICSVFADQPFWGARVTQLGVGATFRFADLDAERLESSLRTALAPEPVARAATLGELLRGRPSAVSRTADLVEAALQD